MTISRRITIKTTEEKVVFLQTLFGRHLKITWENGEIKSIYYHDEHERFPIPPGHIKSLADLFTTAYMEIEGDLEEE